MPCGKHFLRGYGSAPPFINKWHEKCLANIRRRLSQGHPEPLWTEFYRKVEAYINTALEGSEVTSRQPSPGRNGEGLAYAGPNKDNDETVLGFYILAYDITDRILQRTLRKSEREKDLILDSCTELVIYRDLDFKIIWPIGRWNICSGYRTEL